MVYPSWRHEGPSQPAPECCGTGRRSAPQTWHEWRWCRSRRLRTASLSQCLPKAIHTVTARVLTNLAKWNSLSFPGFPDRLSSLFTIIKRKPDVKNHRSSYFGIFLAQCRMSFDAPTQGNPREYLHEPFIFRNWSHWPTFLSLIVVGSKNSLSTFQIPGVFQIYKIPWDFQVFQTCKHPDCNQPRRHVNGFSFYRQNNELHQIF